MRKGVVGRRCTRNSGTEDSFFWNHEMACSTNSMSGDVSRANSAGRMKGVSAPKLLATSAISSLSVETITRSIFFDSFAAAIEYAMRGKPQRSAMLFFGTPLDPPRAGIMAYIPCALPVICA